MNKKLYYIRNITFIIVFGSLFYSIRFSQSLLIFLIMPIIVYLGIITFKESRNNVEYVNFNKTYNILFGLTNIYVIALILRNFFDNYIIMNLFIAEKNAVFLSNNFITIIILYLLLIAYDLLIKKENKTH